MNNRILILAGGLIAVSLAGCQHLGQVMPADSPDQSPEEAAEQAGQAAPEEAAAPQPAAEPERYADLSGELLFDILLGEIAGQRNRLDVAVEHPIARTKYELARWNAQHEMLHIGQIGVIRRLLGMGPWR